MYSQSRYVIVVVLFWLCQLTFGQNLLDSSAWTQGTGNLPGFTQYGGDSNNSRELGSDPYGGVSTLWKAMAPAQGPGQSGGWDSDYVTVADKTKTYRFTVWVKKEGVLTGQNVGKTKFGFYSTSSLYGGLQAKSVDGTFLSNANFFNDFLPDINKWYLMVGYVHGSDYPDTSQIDGGIYDAATGLMVMPVTNEFKFGGPADQLKSRFHLFGAYDVGNSQYLWNPTLYETTDPQMPSVTTMLAQSMNASSVTTQNLMPTDSWIPGVPTTNLSDFNVSGGATQNFIEEQANPFGVQDAIWRATPAGTYKWLGFKTKQQFTSAQIDISKDYRYSLWVKVTVSGKIVSTFIADGTGYNFERPDGSLNARLSINDDSNIPDTGKWYLMVGFIKGINSTSNYDNIAGFYDVVNSNTRVQPLVQQTGRFNPADPNVTFIFGQQFYATTTAHEALFYNPRLEQVSGQEPTIAQLTDPNWVEQTPGDGSTVWSTGANGIYYDGNVGIGVEDTSGYKLAVNGNIHAKEVKVDMIGWPDYVFENNYKLPTLEEVQDHINTKGHLINVPSATEVEQNGLELGEMNKRLTEKIEELTLYILEQHRFNQEMKATLRKLEQNLETKND